MPESKISLLQILRAPFFSSILAPLLNGALLGAIINGSVAWPGLALILVMGLGLHAATNVYNDIYDTLQGTDRINLHRNDFSGGSGLIVQHPELLPRMYRIARCSLLLALFAVVVLLFLLQDRMRFYLIALFALSAFFSKYYTAAPVKLASRGLGEISVWFAFGPMAVLAGALSQNVGFHPYVLAAMPLTGLSTASILWMGQMIDLPADAASGKRGMVARLGSATARYGYVVIHLLLAAGIAFLAWQLQPVGWIILIALLPYLLLFLRAWRLVHRYHDRPDELKAAAGVNVQIHLAFSLLIVLALVFILLSQG